jgi:pyruvate dehydrogenase E1 component
VEAFLNDSGPTSESLGAITLPAREKLDNLIFVINCNLQRLDGPVRGNGQIIRELKPFAVQLERHQMLWGKEWDPLLAKDGTAFSSSEWADRRRPVPESAVESGAYLREHFWGVDPGCSTWSST